MKYIRYLFQMVPVLWSSIKDLIEGGLSPEEIKINYLFGKANAYEQAELLESSIQVFRKILERDPQRVPVFMNLGGLYFRRGMIEKASSYYEKVIRLNPKHYQSHYWLAFCYWRLKRYYAAINTLEDVIEYLPTFKDALNLMGDCYERIGEGAKAEHFYLKAITANPEKRVVYGGFPNRQAPDRKREENIRH